MNDKLYKRAAFSLVELLVTIAIIGILAALLLSGLSAAQSSAQRATCLNNLRQINLGVRMYCDDSSDKAPTSGQTRSPYTAYKEMMKSYLGSRGASSTRDKIFSCPADTFYYDLSLKQPAYVPQSFSAQSNTDFSSYVFNSGNLMVRPNSTARPGIASLPLRAVKHPARTALVYEMPAVAPYSWHKPKWPKQPAYALTLNHCNFIFSNAMNMISYVDGHVSYQPIYWRLPSTNGMVAADYDPPQQYGYQWSAD